MFAHLSFRFPPGFHSLCSVVEDCYSCCFKLYRLAVLLARRAFDNGLFVFFYELECIPLLYDCEYNTHFP